MRGFWIVNIKSTRGVPESAEWISVMKFCRFEFMMGLTHINDSPTFFDLTTPSVLF
jgi:hypothetical protein